MNPKTNINVKAVILKNFEQLEIATQYTFYDETLGKLLQLVKNDKCQQLNSIDEIQVFEYVKSNNEYRDKTGNFILIFPPQNGQRQWFQI